MKVEIKISKGNFCYVVYAKKNVFFRNNYTELNCMKQLVFFSTKNLQNVQNIFVKLRKLLFL